MPISASQHRISVGAYNNDLMKNIKQINKINNSTEHENKIRFFGGYINSAINSFEVMSNVPCQNIAPGGITASLLMLLCHIRLLDNFSSISTDNSALVSGNIVPFSDAGRNGYFPSDGSYFDTILNPITNAIHKTGQFISRYDPLRFPLAEATMIPVESISRYEIQSETINNALFHELTGEDISNILPNKKIEPVIIFHSTNPPTVTDQQLAPAEIKIPETNTVYMRHMAESCNVITKTNDGVIVGNTLLMSSDIYHDFIRYAVEKIYGKVIDGSEVPSWLMKFTESMNVKYDLVLGVMATDISPVIKYATVKSLWTTGYALNKNCLINEFNREDLATLFIDIEMEEINRQKHIFGSKNIFKYGKNIKLPDPSDIEIKIGTAGNILNNPVVQADSISSPLSKLKKQLASIFKYDKMEPYSPTLGHPNTKKFIPDGPSTSRVNQLGKAQEFIPDGMFVQQNVANNINTVKHMTVDYDGIRYMIREKNPGEYWTYHPHAANPKLLEKRVYFDRVSNQIHFDKDMPRELGLDYTISDGKKFINIHGENHEIRWNWDEKFAEVVKKNDVNSIHIPVYMDPLSKKWHYSIHGNHKVFSSEEVEIIKKIKVEKGDFSYTSAINENSGIYGNGHIYTQKKRGDKSQIELGHYIEMNGELVPVRQREFLYEVYDLSNPQVRGYAIQWEGDRWIFEKRTSVYVSNDLKREIVPELFSEKISAGMLAGPDDKGLRHSPNGDLYLAIKGKYIRLKKVASETGMTERYSIKSDNGSLLYIRRKDDGFFYPESFDEWTEIIYRQKAMKSEPIEGKDDLNRIYEGAGFNRKLPEVDGVEYIVINDKNHINIDSKLYEVFWDSHKNVFEVMVRKRDGSFTNIPVYMEQLSQNWHFSENKAKVFFNRKEISVINKIKVEVGGYAYRQIMNENTHLYGNGNLFSREQFESRTHTLKNRYGKKDQSTIATTTGGYYVEMNGALVPVRKITNDKYGFIYTIFDKNNAMKRGYPIQWDGNRWLFDKKTSIYVSEDLNQAINPTQFSEKTSAGMLSVPDSDGLRYRENGDAYLLIQGKYIKLSKTTSEIKNIERYSISKDDGTLLYVRLKDDGLFHIESFDEGLDFNNKLQAMNAEHIYKDKYTKNGIPKNSGLKYKSVNGKDFIDINGDSHEIFWNSQKGYFEIKLNEKNKHLIHIPVYMEPLSKTWHRSVHKDKVFFNQDEIAIIKKIKVEEGDFAYIPVNNENSNVYGNGHIYIEKRFEDHSHKHLGHYVEMNGELVPVRKITNDKQMAIYAVYDLNNPLKTNYPIQWDGSRWLFDKKTSIYVAEDLSQAIIPTQFSEKTSSGMLSAPDNNGLRHTMNGDAYLIIQGRHIKIKKADSLSGATERYSIRKDDGTLLYIRLKEDGLFHLESFDEWLDFMRRLTVENAYRPHDKVYSEHIYEEISFNNKMPEIPGLDYSVVDGKNMIRIQSDNHEVFWNWNKNHPEIVLKKMDGNSIAIPVYMEPISKMWHLSKYKNRRFFSKDNILTLNKIKIEKEGYSYELVKNDNYKLYGSGHLYVRKGNEENLIYYVEINGELAPVRKFTQRNGEVIYVIYDLKNPELRGHAIQWDGNRWLFSKKSDISVSEDLIKMMDSKKFTEKTSAGMLSGGDSNGLRHADNGDAYLLINNKHVNIKKEASEPGVIERYSIKDDNGVLLYLRRKDDGLFHVESFEERQGFMHRLNLQSRSETQDVTFLTLRHENMMKITTKGSRHAESVLFPVHAFGNFDSRIVKVSSYSNEITHLTDNQYSAVMSWSYIYENYQRLWFHGGSPAMYNLNHALHNNIKLDETQQFIYENIISALNSKNYPTKEGSYFHMLSHRMDSDFSAIENLNIGDVVTNSNLFMSVSDNSVFINKKAINILDYFTDRVMITYRIDKASKAKPIYYDKLSKVKYEEEYLYLPESYFKVTGVSLSHSRKSPATIGISLEEVVQPDGIIAKDIFTFLKIE